jgi:hypothetical protein
MSPGRGSKTSPALGQPPTLRPRPSTLGRSPGKPPAFEVPPGEAQQRYDMAAGGAPPPAGKAYFKPESRVNENVTVTVRFRPLR